MLPTSPRSSVRSTCSSCTAPFSTTATRVSCGAQLMRMSCMEDGGVVMLRAFSSEPDLRLSQQLGRLVQRQTHDTGVAALDAADPGGRAALDRIGAGLAEGLAGRDIPIDVGRRDLGELHARDVDLQRIVA